VKYQNYGVDQHMRWTDVTGDKDLYQSYFREADGSYSTASPAVEDYKEKRGSGSDLSNPSRLFPEDGEMSYVPESDLTKDDLGGMEPLVRMYRGKYTEGPNDREWMQEKDRNYLIQLAEEVAAILPAIGSTVPDSLGLIQAARELCQTVGPKIAEYDFETYDRLEKRLLEEKDRLPGIIVRAKRSSASSATASGGAAVAAAAAIPQTGLQKVAHDDLTYGKELGEGGFGIVYQGVWQHATVAIKKLKHQKLTEDSVADLHDEATVMSQLHNPHIVQFYGFCFESPHFAIVMEYMPDGSMYGLLHSDQPLTWDARTQMGIDVGAGLEYLHQQDILHRDLKSMNVLMHQQGGAYRCKLTDFGLSKVKNETKLTTTMGGKGTLAWMAPELFERRAIYSPASDVYSYAIVLWELASRAIPFADAHNPALISTWVAKGDREDIPSDTPAAMIDAISQGWAQDAAARLTAIQIVDLLRASQTHAEPTQQQQQVQQQSQAKRPQAKAAGVAGNFASQRPKAVAHGKVAGNLASFKPAAGRGMPVAKRGLGPKIGMRPKSGMIPKRGLSPKSGMCPQSVMIPKRDAAPKTGPGLFQANLASAVAKQAAAQPKRGMQR